MSSPGSYRRRLIGTALLALPILELALIIIVGRSVGVLATMLLLLVAAIAGLVVLRRAGAAAARTLLMRSGQVPPAGPVMAGQPIMPTVPEPPGGTALLVPAGLLLLVPGFLSDVAGLLLLVPTVRRGVATRLGDAITRRLDVRTVRSVRVVPGEVVDIQVTDVRTAGDRRSRPELPPPAEPR